MYYLLLILSLIGYGTAFSQIGAEAQGGTVTSWFALGFDQELSSRLVSVTDFGYGRHSNPDNLALFQKQGLIVITQDFIYRINRHWRVAASFGYWRRNYYDENPPYEPVPGYEYRNELRPFERIYYDHQMGKILVTHTLRLDHRFYWEPDYVSRWPTPFEFRIRYMINMKFPLTLDHLNQLILVDEVLAANDNYNSADAATYGKAWTGMNLTENRFSLYYRRRIEGMEADLDVGFMHQYWREVKQTDFTDSYNLMIDLIFYNPFSRRRSD